MSLGLEIVGLALTILEIYFPRASLRFEAWIDRVPAAYGRLLAALLRPLAHAGVLGLTIGRNRQERRDLHAAIARADLAPRRFFIELALVFAGFGVLFAMLTVIVTGLFILKSEIEGTEFPFLVPVAMGVVAAVFAGPALLALVTGVLLVLVGSVLRGIVAGLNAITGGHAIGTVGLTLSITGLLLELAVPG